MISAMYLVDLKEDTWIYGFQYSGRIFLRSVPNPWEAMSIMEQEELYAGLLNDAFIFHRERALSKRPEDIVDEVLMKDIDQILDEEEDGEYDDLSDISTEELWDELQRRNSTESEDTE